MKIGDIYEVTYYDHYDTYDKAPDEAKKNPDFIFRACGTYIGETEQYMILAWNYSLSGNPNSNDNTHIIKDAVIKTRRLG